MWQLSDKEQYIGMETLYVTCGNNWKQDRGGIEFLLEINIP